MSEDLLQYGTRHYAHYECYLKAGKKIDDLHAWQIRNYPYRLLKDYGLVETANRLLAEADKRDAEWKRKRKVSA
jgi:hypothetical protein